MPIYATITAGARLEGAFAADAGCRIKALARVRGRAMLDAAVDAVRGCGVAGIAVVGDAELHAACADRIDRAIPESASGAENVRRALRAWPSDAPLLYVASDLPYVTAEALCEFVARVPPGTLAMALVEECDYVRRFPNAPARAVALSGERVINGCAFLIPAGAAGAVEASAMRFFDARKSLLRMARLLGPNLLLRFTLRRLSIAGIEARARRILGVPALGVRGCAPELAFDVDTPAEYRYACERD